MKTDFKKTLDSYAARRGEFRIIDVAPLQYLMVDGHGDPNTAKEYTNAIGALYPIAYKLKSGLRMTGKHHEIYLSDSRRVEPSKLRTILRQPVTPARAVQDLRAD